MKPLSRSQSNAEWESFENFDLVSGCDGRPSVYSGSRGHPFSAREPHDRLLEKLRKVHCCSRYDFPAKLVKHFDVAKFIRERIKQ
jgi:hypothetical protein